MLEQTGQGKLEDFFNLHCCALHLLNPGLLLLGPAIIGRALGPDVGDLLGHGLLVTLAPLVKGDALMTQDIAL